MRPLTDTTPKPLINVANKPLVQYAYDNLRRSKVERIIVNVHYLADQVEAWVKAKGDDALLVSDEKKQLLDSGGGVVNALKLMAADKFFVLNADSFWIDTRAPAHSLQDMQKHMEDGELDFVLLLAERGAAVGYDGLGDFFCDLDGRLERRGKADVAPYVYAGCYLATKTAYRDAPEGPFSVNMLWDRAIAANRARGVVLDGHWLHVGTPQAIGAAENVIRTLAR